MTETFELVDWHDPILYQPVKRFDFNSPPFPPEDYAKWLIATMTAKGGIGLASNQVGIGLAAFALWSTPPVVIFNPKIVDVSEETILLEESCLSYPGLVLTIKRPMFCRLRFTNDKGQILTRKFEGLTARVIQHEIEHLEGKSFLGRVSRLKLEMAVRKAKKLGHDYAGIYKCR